MGGGQKVTEDKSSVTDIMVKACFWAACLLWLCNIWNAFIWSGTDEQNIVRDKMMLFFFLEYLQAFIPSFLFL